VIGALSETPKDMTMEAAEAAGIRHARLPMQETLGYVFIYAFF